MTRPEITWRVVNAEFGSTTDGWRRFLMELYVGEETRYFQGKVHALLDRYPWVEFTELYPDLQPKLTLPTWKVSISHDYVTRWGIADVVEAFLEELYPSPPPDLTGRPDVWLVMTGEWA